MKNFLWEIVGIIICACLIYFVLSPSAGEKISIGDECGQGYHWEEDFRGTVGGCVSDSNY